MARQMKDSGVEWIGDIPEGWSTKRLSFLFDEVARKVSDKDFPPLSVTKQGILPQIEGVAKTDNGDNRKLVRVGDFVINSRSDRKGASGVSEYDGSVSLINIVFQPKVSVNMRYMHHLLRCCGFQEEFYRWGHGIVADLWTTNSSDAKNIILPTPSYEEQTHIADTLDAKCTEIDKVVEQTRATIEEYKKLKQAIITEAVTKGVRGSRPMKPSGVEWIGDIPEEWRVCKLKKVITFINGYAFDSSALSSDGDIRVIRIGDLKNGLVLYESALKSHYTGELDRFRILDGDILIAMSGATVGKIAIVQNLPVCACINQRVGIIRTNINGFIKYILMSTGFARLISLLSEGTAQPNISTENIKDFVICLPDSLEQQEISSYLDTKCAEIDRIIEKKEQLIEELGSYKKSLIYEYVTGKKEVTA